MSFGLAQVSSPAPAEELLLEYCEESLTPGQAPDEWPPGNLEWPGTCVMMSTGFAQIVHYLCLF